tara:strand:- start:625 stop:831 length:207 start_codon:yes stop_codon:yes gene_type:complete
MDEDHLNLEIRKFLKKVGISSQRILESHIKESNKKGIFKIGDVIDVEMKMNVKNNNLEHSVSEKILLK